MMDTNTNGLIIQKPAGPSDGYDGGLKVERDCSGLAGGQRGNVNTPAYFHTITGKNQAAFEWTATFVLDNFADAGENSPAYFQANKHSSGPTWASVFEANEMVAVGGSLVSQEIDVNVCSPDNGQKFAVDVILGNRTPGKAVGASAFMRIGTQKGATWTRGFHFTGRYIVGIDMSQAQVNTPIRLGAGMRLTFEEYDGIGISFQSGMFVFDNGGSPKMVLDMDTGDLHIAGKLTQGAP